MTMRPARGLAFLAVSMGLVLPGIAAAHFNLLSPASWRVLDAFGGPQKIGPCGEEGTAAASGTVTAFAPGDTVTITIDETIYHPGHYRVALAVNDRSELPPEPVVTPSGNDPCASVAIQDPPVFPVLADGLLVHTTAFPGTQVMQVTLPLDVTCDHCTLQVLEYMSHHGAPCFYHHCADISIQPATPSGCASDAECDDSNACTTNHCDTGTGTCAYTPIDVASCDDANVCTRDTCASVEGCVHTALGLGDVDTDFLGSLSLPACADDTVPRGVAALFAKAEALVARAAQKPGKAARLLGRAKSRLRGASAKLAKAHGLSGDCASALGDVLGGSESRVDCVRQSGVVAR